MFAKKSHHSPGLKRAALWILLVGMALVAGTCVPKAGPAGRALTVVSYNVNYGVPGPAEAVAALREADADIVCLQETNATWEAALRHGLADKYKQMLFRHLPAAGGLAVLSKWPLTDVAYHWPKVKGSWFPGWLLTAETPDGPVQLLNVHLRPALSDQGSATLVGVVTSARVRRGEIEELHEQLDPGTPAIMLGDFNEGDQGDALRWLKSKGLTSALTKYQPLATTWHHTMGVLPIVSRFDHVFHTDHFTCTGARVIRKGLSDHFPVLAVLTRRQQR